MIQTTTADPLDIEGLEKLLADSVRLSRGYEQTCARFMTGGSAAVGDVSWSECRGASEALRVAAVNALPRLLSLAREAEGMREALSRLGAITPERANCHTATEMASFVRAIAKGAIRAALNPSASASTEEGA
jgi:hypothetical protein